MPQKKIFISLLVGVVIFIVLQHFTNVREGMTGGATPTPNSPSPVSSSPVSPAPVSSSPTASLTHPSASANPPPAPKPPASSFKIVASTAAATPATAAAIIASQVKQPSYKIPVIAKSPPSPIATPPSLPVTTPPTPPVSPVTTPAASGSAANSIGAPLSTNPNDFLDHSGGHRHHHHRRHNFDSRGTGDGSGFYYWDVPMLAGDLWVPPGIMDLTRPVPVVDIATPITQLPQSHLSLGPVMIALSLVTLLIFLFSRRG